MFKHPHQPLYFFEYSVQLFLYCLTYFGGIVPPTSQYIISDRITGLKLKMQSALNTDQHVTR
jgi:hypothetical protein